MMRETTSAALARPDTTALSESMPPVLAPPGLLIAVVDRSRRGRGGVIVRVARCSERRAGAGGRVSAAIAVEQCARPLARDLDVRGERGSASGAVQPVLVHRGADALQAVGLCVEGGEAIHLGRWLEELAGREHGRRGGSLGRRDRRRPAAGRWAVAAPACKAASRSKATPASPPRTKRSSTPPACGHTTTAYRCPPSSSLPFPTTPSSRLHSTRAPPCPPTPPLSAAPLPPSQTPPP